MKNTCASCKGVYESSGKSGFCPDCRKLHDSDICEIITSPDTVIIFSSKDKEKDKEKENEIIQFLENLNLRANVKLRLDLHEVLDTTEPTEKLYDGREGNKICALSYVGKITKTRVEARSEIQERIGSGQIDFGILVFKRGRDKHAAFTEVGSKAWFNTLLDNSCDPLFVDDSMDHVVSVSSVGIRSVQMFQQDVLSDLISKNC